MNNDVACHSVICPYAFSIDETAPMKQTCNFQYIQSGLHINLARFQLSCPIVI